MSLLAYLAECMDRAATEQQSAPETPIASAASDCPYADARRLTLIPRRPSNVFDAGDYLKPLLPGRYPPADLPLKTIEYNAYPDLNRLRAITAVVTETPWAVQCDPRPAPRAGVTVYFRLGARTTADVTLSAMQAVSDGEGRASVALTVNSLSRTKDAIEQAGCIELFASLQPACAIADPSLTLTIHRNEDVDTPLGDTESPDDFAATLRPVVELQTWIVRQRQDWVTSNGVRALQQLLNQVACRRRGGGHGFLRPDGQFGEGSRAENARFIADFSGVPGAGATAAAVFSARQFAVQVEENAAGTQGVKTYVRAEYGAYADGDLVDGHLLIGATAWTPGSAARIRDADGLLDLYRAVVWEFIERLRERAEEYVAGARNGQTARTWYRHPSDNGGHHNWPATCAEGEAYWYGGARSLDLFHADLAANRAALVPGEAAHWVHYLRQTNSRIGLHGADADNRVAVPTVSYPAHAHLNTDSTIVNVGTAAAPRWQLRHIFGTHNGQYTGIDCSAFCQALALEARFRAEHCADLADTRICPLLPEITHNANSGWATSRLTTSTWSSGNHYRRMPNQTWRPEIVYRGDLFNVPGSHIVALATNSRSSLTGGAAGNLWIWHANGTTGVRAAAAPHWNPSACIRRVVHSPLAQFASAWGSWGQTTAAVHYGRIYLWQ